ncbi:uncharacterized protein YecE (DUF72 family) [Actinocorallia herbida]|uniref:Uncharacterized protein YecE (DUF72 family) n=1 Tax=Actinocorallia herbida TaxID=58109 RepID=A0A3N1CTY1_9ACTN|nr:DUF72 domain-containing protein [Actinocorallia herbida]ROO84685.1 uncharacterized protein YecE (DUF72 family) [Actinocorallia herbida]
MNELLVGTSGWMYDDWRTRFYPGDVAKKRWLAYYGARFPTVENNNAFYRLPERDTFAGWKASVPDGFVMAVKASRYLTHMKRLRDPAEPVRRLLRAAEGLGTALGPVLLQLPPTLRGDPDRLAACLRAFPRGVPVAVEPRHPSWWTGDVRRVLEARGAALVWADRLGRPQGPLWATADWAYLRLHEGAAAPRPHYGDRALGAWLDRLTEGGPFTRTFAYLNNDHGGAAVRDAERFRDLAAAAGLTAPSAPRAAVAGSRSPRRSSPVRR